jgi:hypothetical protein
MERAGSYGDRVRRFATAASAGLAVLSLSVPSTVAATRTSASGGVVGLRGSMPGTGNGDEQMYMIFRLQYRGTHHRWHYLAGADSGLVAVGSSQFRSRQAGLDFHLALGDSSGNVVRGVVKFEWRVATRVVHGTKSKTTAGHVASAGASPPGFSAAHCTIS